MEETREDWLAKANEAEAQAALTNNPVLQRNWLRIAARYRQLVEQTTKDRSDED
jgi:hypothetical protein